jgi:hypothetical protein
MYRPVKHRQLQDSKRLEQHQDGRWSRGLEAPMISRQRSKNTQGRCGAEEFQIVALVRFWMQSLLEIIDAWASLWQERMFNSNTRLRRKLPIKLFGSNWICGMGKAEWSLVAWPEESSTKLRARSGRSSPATTSVTCCTRTSIRSCNIFTAALWVCKWDSTGRRVDEIEIRSESWMYGLSLRHLL